MQKYFKAMNSPSQALQRLHHLLPQIISPLDGITISDKFKVTVQCGCGKQVTLSARNLVRKWQAGPYRCKSCDVKTYANDPQKIARYKQSFQHTLETTDLRERLTDASHKAWAKPANRQAAADRLRARNQTDQRLIAGRRKAHKVFMETLGKEHLAKIRAKGIAAAKQRYVDDPTILARFAQNFKLHDPAVKHKHRKSTILASKLKWRDPVYRAKIKQIMDSPEYKANLSLRAQQMWQSQDYRQRMLAIYSDPEWKAKASARSKEINNRPEVRMARALALINMPSISKLEDTFASILDDMQIQYRRQHLIGWYTFDFLVPDKNLIIEVNGDWFHSAPAQRSRDAAKASYIKEHFPKYQLRYIWEHEFGSPERVRSLVDSWINPIAAPITKFSLADVQYATVTDPSAAILLLSKYHCLGRIGRHSLIIEFRLRDQLVGCIIYAPPTRRESALRLGLIPSLVLELTRMCIHPQYQQKNFASWMIARSISVVKQLKPKVKHLLSFADPAFGHTGTIYKAAGFKSDGKTAPSYEYQDHDGFVMHKKVLYNHARKNHMTEADFATMYGYTKIPKPPKHRYVYQM